MKNAVVAVYDSDRQFADNLTGRLAELGIACTVCRSLDEARMMLFAPETDVLVFGTEEVGSEVMRFLTQVGRPDACAQVILMVRKNQVRLSIEGMKNGAFDDIYIPFALDALLVRLSLSVGQAKLARRRRQCTGVQQSGKGSPQGRG